MVFVITVFKKLLEKHKKERIRNKWKNNFPGYVIIEKIKHDYEKIIVDEKEYDSIADTVKANEAPDCFVAIRRLKSKKYKNYLYPKKRINKEE